MKHPVSCFFDSENFLKQNIFNIIFPPVKKVGMKKMNVSEKIVTRRWVWSRENFSSEKNNIKILVLEKISMLLKM